jgi:hypothetical protein
MAENFRTEVAIGRPPVQPLATTQQRGTTPNEGRNTLRFWHGWRRRRDGQPGAERGRGVAAHVDKQQCKQHDAPLARGLRSKHTATVPPLRRRHPRRLPPRPLASTVYALGHLEPWRHWRWESQLEPQRGWRKWYSPPKCAIRIAGTETFVQRSRMC